METGFKKIVQRNVQNVWAFFLDLVFPVECLGCGQVGKWLCSNCLKNIKLNSRQYCLECKTTTKFGQFCAADKDKYALNVVWIAADYDEPVIAKMVKSFKYSFIKSLGNDLAEILIMFLKNLLGQPLLAGQIEVKENVNGDITGGQSVLKDFKSSIIMPVPLSTKRKRWRGFNQAEILARTLGMNLDLEVNSQNLIRIKHKKPQAKLGEAERKINVADCFSWQGRDLTAQNVILIDDVVTTGATLNECAKVLKQAGAGQVWALVVAKG